MRDDLLLFDCYKLIVKLVSLKYQETIKAKAMGKGNSDVCEEREKRTMGEHLVFDLEWRLELKASGIVHDDFCADNVSNLLLLG